MLVLVNANHTLPSDFRIDEFTELVNDHKVDKRIYPDLQKMFDDAREAGQSPSITASYMSPEDAKNVELPCALDHTTGLAIDITSPSMDWALSQDFAEYPEGQWLDEHCQDYGFILRYPKGKEDITGYGYEPWHFRYVGKDVAKEIMSKGITFEEYLGEA